MIGNGADQLTTTGAASTAVAPITAADQARIDRALRDARSPNTRAQYRSAWRGWVVWTAEHGHVAMPAIPDAIVAHLTHRAEQGASVATVRMARAAISAAHRHRAPPPIRASIRAWCRCSRACRAAARAGAAVRCRGSIGAPPILLRASLRTAGTHSPASAMRHSFRLCRMRCCGSVKRQRWTWPTCNARSTAAARSRWAARKPTRKGAGTCATSARLPCSAWQRGLAAPAAPPAGRCSAKCSRMAPPSPGASASGQSVRSSSGAQQPPASPDACRDTRSGSAARSHSPPLGPVWSSCRKLAIGKRRPCRRTTRGTSSPHAAPLQPRLLPGQPRPSTPRATSEGAKPESTPRSMLS